MDNPYEVIMSNGDRAECERVAAVLPCVSQLVEDAEDEEVFVDSITIHGEHSKALTRFARIHHLEELTERAEVGGWLTFLRMMRGGD